MIDRNEQPNHGGFAGPSPTKGHLLLADITGYTQYLNDSELDHAQNVVADLASVIVSGLTPVFEKSKLEGDAVLAYAVAGALDGSLMLDVVEETYFAFRRRVRDVDLATTCDCNACQLIPSLDLKFVVHSGEFIVSEIAGSEELTGSDVILAHRLLKNNVREVLGFDAYALLTSACVGSFGMEPTTLGLVEHIETYNTIGEVTSYVEDLTQRWAFEEERHNIFVTRANAEMEVVWESDASIPTLWDYLTSPEKRLLWQEFDDIDQVNPSGKVGVGTTNHCKHGKGEVTEEVLDWKPYRYFTTKIRLPMIGDWVQTHEFTDSEGGGSVALMRAERLSGWKKLLWVAMRPMMMRNLDRNRARLKELLSAETHIPED